MLWYYSMVQALPVCGKEEDGVSFQRPLELAVPTYRVCLLKGEFVLGVLMVTCLGLQARNREGYQEHGGLSYLLRKRY